MKLNKFVKFPLVLGIVGTICAGALGVVYEITNPVIQYNNNKEAFEKLQSIVPDMTGAESIVESLDSDKLSDASITNVYEVSVGGKVDSYAYQASGTGYGGAMNFIVVLDADENKIVGFKVVSHNETNSGSYGGPLLNDPAFAEQFTGLSYDELNTSVDFTAGSTAKITLNGIISAVNTVIDFHRYEILGEVNDGIKLNGGERTLLGLPEGQILVDKTEEFKELLGNKVDDAVKELGLLNYVDITDATGAVVGHGYIVEQSYSCELEHGARGTKTYKMAYLFDQNWENSRLVVVASDDTLGDSTMLEDKYKDYTTIIDHPWLVEKFNGLKMADLVASYNPDEVDKIHGATFTSNTIKNHISAIVFWHDRAGIQG